MAEQAVAKLKYARISPRKVKIVLDLIRGKNAKMAMAILKNTQKGACEYLIKLLGSAMANAENNFQMDTDKLYVAECFVCTSAIASSAVLPASTHFTSVESTCPATSRSLASCTA